MLLFFFFFGGGGHLALEYGAWRTIFSVFEVPIVRTLNPKSTFSFINTELSNLTKNEIVLPFNGLNFFGRVLLSTLPLILPPKHNGVGGWVGGWMEGVPLT